MTRDADWQPPCSLLLVPGDRPELLAKANRTHPDALIIDLEDGVAPAQKDVARRIAGEAAVSLAAQRLGDVDTFIRVNPAQSPWFDADVDAALAAGAGIVLPKCEAHGDVNKVHARVRAYGAPAIRLIAGIETARGVANVEHLAKAGLAGIYFGAEDFIANVGGRRTRAGVEVLYARSRVLLASRAVGIAPIDQAVVDVRDDDAFIESCEEALALGYQSKLCIHPRQVELVHQTFDPGETEVEQATRIIAAYQAALDSGAGICVVDGRMIDAPLVEQAHQIERRALRASARRGA